MLNNRKGKGRKGLQFSQQKGKIRKNFYIDISRKYRGRVFTHYNLTEEEYSLILKESNCTVPFRVAALNIYRDIARGKIK